jgi:hypothetical protein
MTYVAPSPKSAQEGKISRSSNTESTEILMPQVTKSTALTAILPNEYSGIGPQAGAGGVGCARRNPKEERCGNGLLTSWLGGFV